jgi:signal transduction histidine kinase
MNDPADPEPTGRVATADRRLLDAVVAVADGLELTPTLGRIVRAAADLTLARYAALGVLGPDGLHRAFVYTGIDPATAQRIGHLPRGHGVLGHITRTGHAVRVDELSKHPASVGFPSNHPPMGSFLGVPVGIGDRVVGNLYLSAKPGGFTADDEDIVVALAAAAAVAVENARLYEDATARRLWLAASQEVTLATLSGAEDEEVLALVARRAREVAGAAVAALVLPGLGEEWILEIADVAPGTDAGDLVGTRMSPLGRAMAVIASGEGLLVGDLSAEPELTVPRLRRFGPALYAPLTAGVPLGVLMLLRDIGQPGFTETDLATTQTFAAQAAVALQLADARRRGERAELLADRARIARDLHDLVIQELFALGMRLNRLRSAAAEADPDLNASLESLDRVVRQIRSTIRALRDPSEPNGLAPRLRAEVARADATLGFAPRLVLTGIDSLAELDGLTPADPLPPEVMDDMVAVVREGLSNAARHAAASTVTVTVTVTATQASVTVSDDGVGLQPDGRRSGLDNLSERARRHGGSCTVTGRDGTTILWQVPLAS